jgi:hypothetical protein
MATVKRECAVRNANFGARMDKWESTYIKWFASSESICRVVGIFFNNIVSKLSKEIM